MAQAHRIPGDLLPHGPAGPAPVATGCVGARDPPDGLAAGAIQGSGAALHVRSWQTLALLLPNCRECAPDPVVGFTPNHEVTCSRSVLPVLSGESWTSIAYRLDQAWCSSRLLENLAISRQLTSSDDPWETLAGGHFDASFSNAAR